VGLTLIVKSQFEGVYDVIRSAIPDHPETFKGVRLNAFCRFKVMPQAFRYFKGREHYEQEKRKRYDDKNSATSFFIIEGDKVLVNPKALLIPEFAFIHERDRSQNKRKSTKEFAYVYYMSDYKSEYNAYGLNKQEQIGKGYIWEQAI
jgi:hypothetical protein